MGIAKKIIVPVVLSGVLAASACSGESRIINVVTPANGASVSLNNDKICDFVKEYLLWTSFSELSKTAGEQYYPKPVRIEWEGADDGNYILYISENESFTDAREYDCEGKFLELQNLYCGRKYYYKVVSKEGRFASAPLNFVTKREPRTIKIDGVSNTRDIGGYAVYDGDSAESPIGYVKQGMIYRGANLDGVTEKGKKTVKDLGIKTILDLREKEYRKQSIENVSYIELPDCGGPCYVNGGMGITDEKYIGSLMAEVKTFADEKNYPVYMHCQIGRDRTGTLAFIINALLGVSYEDLALDYELSVFSVSGRCDYDDYEKMKTNITGAFDSLYSFFMKYSEDENGERLLKRGVETFLIDNGVTTEEIERIKNIMTEKEGKIYEK